MIHDLCYFIAILPTHLTWVYKRKRAKNVRDLRCSFRKLARIDDDNKPKTIMLFVVSSVLAIWNLFATCHSCVAMVLIDEILKLKSKGTKVSHKEMGSCH